MRNRSSHHGAAETNPTRNHEALGTVPGFSQWLRVQHCHEHGVGHRRSSDLMLLWLWCRPAAKETKRTKKRKKQKEKRKTKKEKKKRKEKKRKKEKE